MTAAAGAAGTADRTDRRTGRSAGHMDPVAAGNDALDRFARFRINPQGLIFHALLDLETPRRPGRIGRFVNVGWHNESGDLLGRVPPGRFLGFGYFFAGIRVHPLGVKNAWLVDPLVGVGAEEIALRLEQIGREARLAVTVEVA
jgi:hypothetical protein